MNKLKNIFKNKIFLTIFLSGIVFGIVFLLPGFFNILDKKLTYYFLYNEDKKINDNIIMVNLDEETIKYKKTFPFSRGVYSDIIKKLKFKGVSVIGFDIILSENNPDKQGDEDLSKSLSTYDGIVLGGQINNQGKDFIVPPIDKFVIPNKTKSFGYFSPKVDRFTGQVYSFIPKKKFLIKTLPIKGYTREGEIFYHCKNGNTKIEEENANKKICNTPKFFNHFTIEILKKFTKQNNNSIYKNNLGINVADLKIVPYSFFGSNEVLINYIPRQNIKNKQKNFTEISMLDILENTPKFEKLDFKNKIVLVGATAKGLKDIFNTPYGEEFGVYIHGNILNTLINNKKPLIYFNLKLELILLYFFTITILILNFVRNNKILFFGNLFFIFIFYILNNFLTNNGLILNHPSYLIVTFILSITFSNIAKYLIENKDKKKMLKAFGEYISKDIAEEILNGEGNINLEGERKKISIFFSDIEGFTTISEKLKPEELVVFLREYLGSMSNIIMDEKGLIDKYEGDAIMALWGVFGHESSSTFDNCNSALKQQEKLKILNIEWKKRFGEELKIRMGLNTGEAIVGNIGSSGRKMEFTALGDAVNLASRLEEVNKKYGTYLCVSETVYEEQKNNFEFRYLDKIRVKGKTIPVSIYELLSKKGELSDLKKDILKGFSIGIELYLKQEFKKASEIFNKLSKIGDKPSLTYAKRCLQFEIVPPEKDWDGVWTMKSK